MPLYRETVRRFGFLYLDNFPGAYRIHNRRRRPLKRTRHASRTY